MVGPSSIDCSGSGSGSVIKIERRGARKNLSI